MIHIVKMYKNLMLGLVESRVVNENHIKAVAAIDGDSETLSMNDITKGLANKNIKGRVKEIYSALEKDDKLLTKLEGQGLSVKEAIKAILGTIDNTKNETKALKKDVAASSGGKYDITTGQFVEEKGSSVNESKVQTKSLADVKKELYSVVPKHEQHLINKITKVDHGPHKYLKKYLNASPVTSTNDNTKHETLGAKHDFTATGTGDSGYEISSMEGTNRRAFDNIIGKLNYKQLTALVQELAKAAGTSVNNIRNKAVGNYFGLGNANKILKVFKKRGYKVNTSMGSKEAMQLLNQTANILKTQNDVREAPRMEKLKLLFDFNKDNYLTNHPEFYFTEINALTNAVNNGAFKNPLSKNNASVKFSYTHFGNLVNNIGLGSGAELLKRMDNGFYGAREAFIDALGVSAAGLQAAAGKGGKKGINPLVLFMKDGMKRGFDELGTPTKSVENNQKNIQKASAMIDKVLPAGANLSAQDRSRCISMILSSGGVGFAKGRVDVGIHNGKPALGYTPYDNGKFRVRLGTFVPLTLGANVNISSRTKIGGSVFGGGAVPLGGSINMTRKTVAENAADVKKWSNKICDDLIAGKLPKDLSEGQRAAIIALKKSAGGSRGTLLQGISRAIEAGAFSKIEGRRVTSVSAGITAIATFLIPSIGVNGEIVSVDYKQVDKRSYAVNPSDIAKIEKEWKVTQQYEKAIYRSKDVQTVHMRRELLTAYNQCGGKISQIESKITHSSMRSSVEQTVARNMVFNFKRGKVGLEQTWGSVSKVTGVSASNDYQKLVLIDAYMNATMKLKDTRDSSDQQKMKNADAAFQNDFGVSPSLVKKWRELYGDFDSRTHTTSMKTDSRITFAASTPTSRPGDKNGRAGKNMPTGMIPYTGVVEIVNRGEINVTRELNVTQKRNVFSKFPTRALQSFGQYYKTGEKTPLSTIINDLANGKLGNTAKVDYTISFGKMGKCGNDALNVKDIKITTTKTVVVKKEVPEQGKWKVTKEIIPKGDTYAPVIGVQGFGLGFVGPAIDTNKDRGQVTTTPIEEGGVETTPTEGSNGSTQTGGAVDNAGSSSGQTSASGTMPPPIGGNSAPAVVPAPSGNASATSAPVITNSGGASISANTAQAAASVNTLSGLEKYCLANPNAPICKGL